MQFLSPRLLGLAALLGAALALGACGDDLEGEPPDDADPCAVCDEDQLCVQSFDGTCTLITACLARTEDCPANACSAACEAAYCGAPFQCMTRSPCGSESELAFTCYGP